MPFRTIYICPRCENEFKVLGNMKKHISRKTLCEESSPTLSSVIPTLKNVNLRRMFVPSSEEEKGSNQSNVITASNNCTIDNSTTINHTHNHIHIHINAFGKEDKSHITPELLSCLIRQHSPSTALRHLVKEVHFNPLAPQNMNVHDPEDEYPSRLQVYDGAIWNLIDKEDTAVQMANTICDDLLKHISKHQDKLGPMHKTEEYDEELKDGIDDSPGMIEDVLETILDNNYHTRAARKKKQ